MARVYLALGSNLGDRAGAISRAEEAIRGLPGTRDVRLSGVYETPAVGGPAGQGAFLNAAVALETELEPRELLERLQGIERAAGRPGRAERERWGPRVLDIDVLLYEDRVIDEPGLKVPHPRMHERWFVLRPLADVGGEAVHPVMRKTVNELLARVEDEENVQGARK